MKRNIKELLCVTAVMGAATIGAALAENLVLDTSNRTISSDVSYDNVSVSSGRQLTVSGAQTNLKVTDTTTNNGTILNSGNIVTNAIDNAATSSVVDGSGNLTLDGGNSVNAGEISQGIIKVTGGTLSNNGTMTANGLFTNTGNITGESGTLNINAGGSSSNAIEQSVINITGGFNNNASLNATTKLTTSGSVNNNSTITAANLTNSGTLTNASGKSITVTNVLTNNSTIDNKGDLSVGTLSNENGKRITGAGNLTVKGGSNSGTITQSTVKNQGAVFANSGTINANVENESGKQLTNSNTINGNVTNAGTFINNANAEINGNTTNTDSFTNNGTILGDIANNGGTFTNSTTGKIGSTSSPVSNITNSGTFSNSGSIIASVIDNTAGTITNNNSINVGTLNNDAEISGAGDLNITNGSNSASIVQANINITTGFTNEGTLEATTKLTTNNGTITNDTGHSIIAAAIDNKATITGGGSLTASGLNSGTISQKDVTLNGALTNTGNITAVNLDTGSSTLTNNAAAGKKLTVTGSTKGTLRGTGAMDIAGTNEADIDMGTVTVTGDLDNQNSIIADAITNNTGVTLSNNGTLGDADSNITNNGTINNNSNIIANSINNTATGTINNESSITSDSIINNGTFDNKSTGTIIADSIANNKSFSNEGSIGSNENRVSITNNGEKFENSGTIIADAINDTTGIVNTNSINTNTIKISANGGITSSDGASGSLTINNGGSNAGTIAQKDITLKGGELNNTGSITSTDNFQNEGTIKGNGNLTVNDGSSKTGSITQDNVTVKGAFSNEADLTANKKLTLEDSANITNTGCTIVAKEIDIAASATIDGNGNIKIAGGINNGTISQADVELSGMLENTKNATITSTKDFTNHAEITGEGTLNINNGSSDAKISQNNVNITGTFVNKAELNVAESLKNEGIIQNSSVITAVINNTADSVIEGTTGSNGTINIISGTNAGSITQSVVNVTGGADKSGTLDNIGTITANTFTNDATISGNGDLVVTNGTNRGSITQTTLENKGTFTTTGENAQTTLTNVDNKGAKYIVDNKATTTISGTIDNTAKGTITINNGSEATIGNIASAADSIINIDNGSTLTVETQENNLIGTINSNGGKNTLGVTGTNENVVITSNINIGNNTNAVLSIVDGVVHADAVIKISNNSELNVAGSNVTLNQNDSWTGQNKVTLDSGALTINNVTNNGLLVATGGELTLEAGTLNVTKGSSIAAGVTTDLKDGTTLNIQNKGQVTLNKGDNWSGKIILGTKGTEAEIKYPTPGEDGQLPLPFDTATIRDNKDITLLDVSGLDTTGTLQANNGVLLLGDKDLDITGESYIAEAVAMQLSGNIKVNNGGSVAIDDNDILQTASGKNPQVTLSDGGTLNYGKTVDSGLDIVADGGKLNLLANSNLTFKQGNIEDAVVINIQKDANLTLDASTLNLDNKDTWNGNIINKGGIINANGLEKSSTSATLTQYTGDLNLYNDSNLVLGTESYIKGTNITIVKGDNGENGSKLTIYGNDDKNVVDGGNMVIDEYSEFKLGSGTFKLDTLAVNSTENEDGTVQAGLVNVMNGMMSDSIIGELVINQVEGKANQANFNIDIYARSNQKTNNDTFIIEKIDPNATAYINEWGLGGDLYGWDAPIDRHIKLKDIFFDATTGEALKTNIEVTDQQTFTPIGWYQLNKNDKTQIVTDENGVPVIDPLTGQVKREVIGSYYTLDLARYNPQVFRGQVATVAQWMNQLNIDDMLFTHSMVLPSFKDPEGGTMANRYAAESPLFAPYQYSRKDGGLWYKMYGTFENLQMNNGLSRVGNNAYGALIGADFGLKDLKNGWKFMPTAYVGYNGAHQTFAHMGQYQNGGQAGFLGTWYKDNIILGALAYGGIYDNSMDVHGFNDSTFNYFAGAATKASYNIRLHRDWVLQPNLFVAYNYFGQQNWHSRFGQMGMMAGQLNGVNIAPGLNLIWEKETFSAYATLQYMYNINGACGGRAGNVDLPKMEMDRGYIQYGLGINKKFTNRASGYLQAVLRNVGRTGVGFQAGFNYMIGK